MNTPDSSRKRKRTNRRLFGDKEHSKATVTVQKRIAPHVTSKADKRFEKKVLKVLKEPTATGKYVQTVTLPLYQLEYNLYSVFENDYGNGSSTGYAQLEFFTPRMFKDAEAVLFNQKVATFNSWATVTQGANYNFPAQQSTKINSSSASFRFKNVSEHKTIVEMYICRGKGGGSASAASDWETGLKAQGRVTVNGISTADSVLIRNTHVQMSSLPNFEAIWKVEKIVMKFEPGEESYHNIQGPKGYMMDGSKKVTENSVFGSTPTWKASEEPGCGLQVFFRVLNNLSLVTSTTGTTVDGNSIAICHPPHKFANGTGTGANKEAGGIAVEITRHYNIEAPLGVTVATNNAYMINTNYGRPSGLVFDNQREEDQPMGNDDGDHA